MTNNYFFNNSDSLLKKIFQNHDLRANAQLFNDNEFSYKNSQNENLIFLAVKYHHDYATLIKNLFFLLEKKVSLIEPNKQKITPFEAFFNKELTFGNYNDSLIKNKFYRAYQLLKDTDIDVNQIIIRNTNIHHQKNNEKENLLTLLCRQKFFQYHSNAYYQENNFPNQFLKWLVEDRQIDLNFTDKYDYSALDIAILQQNPLALEILEYHHLLTDHTLQHAINYAQSSLSSKIENLLISRQIKNPINSISYKRNKI